LVWGGGLGFVVLGFWKGGCGCGLVKSIAHNSIRKRPPASNRQSAAITHPPPNPTPLNPRQHLEVHVGVEHARAVAHGRRR
jgi:hypothetical protein